MLKILFLETPRDKRLHTMFILHSNINNKVKACAVICAKILKKLEQQKRNGKVRGHGCACV